MMSTKTRALVLVSGGIDSAVCLYWGLDQGYEVTGLTMNVQHRPRQELRATRDLCAAAGVDLVEVPLPFLQDAKAFRVAGQPLPFDAVIPPAYIPVKNVIFHGIASYYAEVRRATLIIEGLIAEDAGRFPDATPEYFRQLEVLVKAGLPELPTGEAPPAERSPWSGPEFAFPLLHDDKVAVLRRARALGVPLEHTWSCYLDDPGGVPCGQCVSCRQRAAAFSAVGWADPLLGS